MGNSTRREFVQKSAAAAAGMSVLGTFVTAEADAEVPEDAAPVVAYVKNVRTGEIAVMSGEKTHITHNRQIAAQLTRVAR
jgi:hypothetical protein